MQSSKLKTLQTTIRKTNVEYSIETLVKEIKLVLTSEDDFDYGVKSIWTASSGNFGLTEFWTREKIHMFFENILPYKFLVFNWNLVEKEQDGRDRKSLSLGKNYIQ